MTLDLFNYRDYQRGFDDGKKDAEAGKEAQYLQMGQSIKYVLYGDKSLKTYIEGYNDAYRQTMLNSIPQKIEISQKEETSQLQKEDTISSHRISYSQSEKKNTQVTKKISTNTFINHTISTTMDTQRIDLQLNALRALEQFLNQTIDSLRECMRLYNDRVGALREDGLTYEIAQYYDENYCIPHNQQLWQLAESMEESDLVYLRENIKKFEELQEIASTNYNN